MNTKYNNKRFHWTIRKHSLKNKVCEKPSNRGKNVTVSLKVVGQNFPNFLKIKFGEKFVEILGVTNYGEGSKSEVKDGQVKAQDNKNIITDSGQDGCDELMI